MSLLYASSKFSAGVFKYKLAHCIHAVDHPFSTAAATGLPNPNPNLSWGEGGGMYIIHLLPNYHRLKFTGTDNYSYGQESHQQTRVHVMYLCCLDAYL